MSSKTFDNKTVAAVLREVAFLLEFENENPFRGRAYFNAARSIEMLEEEITQIVEEGRLREIEGVGESIAYHIGQLVVTGTFPLLERLRAAIPPGHREMIRVPGLGPRKIKILYQLMGIKSIGELEYACLENRLVELRGFGQKSQDKILRGIQLVKKYRGRYLYGEVISEAEQLLEKIRSLPRVLRASLAGSLRRKLEIVGNINLVVSTERPGEVLSAVCQFPQVERLRSIETSSAVYTLASGLELDLHAVSDGEYPFRLYRLTGSLSHWDSLREKAMSLGLELSSRHLRRSTVSLPCKEEDDILHALGLDFIPPELREGEGEIEAAQNHRLPHLLREQDIRGVFHVHTYYSDGTNSIKAAAEAALAMGFSYIGIADHSQSAAYAKGLTTDRLRGQWQEIDRLNEELDGLYIFKGTESDIRPDGSLDYDESVLRQFDFVVASVHSHFNMPIAEMTERVIRAVRNPYVTILGHPTGRLLLAREPYSIDMISVIDEAAQTGVTMELNSHPYRLDIDWRLCKYARRKGVRVAIDPDAHNEHGLGDTSYGVGIARKGWLEPGDILNTMAMEEIKVFLKGGIHGKKPH